VESDARSNSRAEPEAQRRAIAAARKRHGWQLVELVADARLSLVAVKPVRLSRSILELATVLATAQKQGWALVALDCAVQSTTPAGEPIANALAVFAQFERQLLSQPDASGARTHARAGRPARPAPRPEQIQQTAYAICRRKNQSLFTISAPEAPPRK
jgi:DNA invertase Pin-like site-specific DNA recombinase